MTNHEVIKKLIGPIRPVGESNTDAQRLSNLIDTCVLIESLLYDIDDMIHKDKGDNQASVKRCVDYAENFLKKTVKEMTPSRENH